MKRSCWMSAVLVCALGCGGTGDVKGSVTYKGEKLTFGTVTANAANGSFPATIDSDGNYELKGLATGKVVFLVYVQNPKMVEVSKELAGNKETPAKDKGGRSSISSLSKESKKTLANPNLVPDRYSDPSKELLVFEVASGKNEYNIKLDP